MPAGGATLTPTITSDELVSPGAGCSLREAALQANSNLIVDAACGPAGDEGATDEIVLAAGATYELTLAGGEDLGAAGDLDILDNAAALDVTITGTSSTISNASSPKDRVLHVLLDATVSISGVTISNGLAVGMSGMPFPANVGESGGILNLGTLTMRDCAVIGNRAVGGDGSGVLGGFGGSGMGGGISTVGPLTLTDCVIRLNVAIGGDGALRSGDGGGSGEGGGLAFFFGGSNSITGSTISGNRAEGGDGGVGDAGTGSARAAVGGGIRKFTGLLSVTNSTISGNAAVPGIGVPISPINARGGGIFVAMGGLALDSVTLTASTPDGIWSDGSGSVTNSIVALQTAGPDCVGGNGSSPTASADFNIDSDGTCGFDQPHDQSGITAPLLGLGPLSDNGGLTQTHAVAPGRAAYDRGSTILSVDQRGVTRPQWFQDDVGAFEQELELSLADVPALSPGALLALAGLLALAALLALRAG